MLIDKEGNETAKSILASKVAPALMSKTITERGVYKASDDGVRGYNEVNVDIPYTDIHVATGSIATFEGEDLPLKSLTASIVPVQAGSGDPSPTNVRPISGWTEEVVSVRGKNKVDGGTLTPSASNTNYSISPTLATGNYVLSFDVSNLAWTNLNNTSFAWTKNSNNTQKDLLSHSIKRVSDNAYLKDLTQPVTGRFYGVFSNVEVASLVIACRNNTYMNFTSGTITNIQLESGSTPSDFEPYTGTTTTIPFTDGQGQSVEVLGGSADVVNGGEQPSTMAVIDLGQRSYTKVVDGFFYSYATDIDFESFNSTDKTALCECYKLCAPSEWYNRTTDMAMFGVSTSQAIYVADSRFTDADDLKTALNGIKLCYTLKNPTTFYTQPTSIKSLNGKNSIYANTGDVDVEYQTVWVRPTE